MGLGTGCVILSTKSMINFVGSGPQLLLRVHVRGSAVNTKSVYSASGLELQLDPKTLTPKP